MKINKLIIVLVLTLCSYKNTFASNFRNILILENNKVINKNEIRKIDYINNNEINFIELNNGRVFYGEELILKKLPGKNNETILSMSSGGTAGG